MTERRGVRGGKARVAWCGSRGAATALQGPEDGEAAGGLVGLARFHRSAVARSLVFSFRDESLWEAIVKREGGNLATHSHS